MFRRYIIIEGVEHEVFTKQIKKSEKPIVQKEYYYNIDKDGIVKMASSEKRPENSLHWDKELKAYKNTDILKAFKKVSGDTFKINGALKSLGFKYQPTEKVWVK